ncbi:unnamed protein product [Adineta steineri]|uniref:Uncharacterized protein n=1 Tax=Adineta steineri TaxID=433720 RepID=A0A815B5R2_9BILA|nr:unnamed protein product [Adineta steineri]
MSIQLPDLSSVLLADNEIFGIILTMVTSTNNLKNKTFVHVNGIKYRTGDAIELENGSIFLPLTKSDIQTGEKIFPRLSIICKKVDEYTFDLTSFDTTTCERIMEKYTTINDDKITNAAKGKQFTTDYDLHSYKFVFQLALKQDDIFKIFLNVKCETNIINEPLTVYFYYPCIGQSVPVGCEFVDAKTISLFTPKCLVTVTRDNPTILVTIIVCQNETEIAKIDFTYQALNECVNCSLNVMPGSMVSPASNKRSIADSEEDNEFEFPNDTVNRTENNEDTKHSTIKKC